MSIPAPLSRAPFSHNLRESGVADRGASSVIRPRRLARLAIVLGLTGLAGACAPSPPRDAQPQAAAEVARAANDGLSRYALAPGDTIEVSYGFSEVQPAGRYALAIGDALDIEFRTQSEYNRHVIVRPDGRISLPAIGEVGALGLTPEALGRRLERAYAGVLVDPKVAVAVASFHSPSDDLKQLVENGAAQRGKTVIVEPDGSVNLPLLPPLRVAGASVAEAGRALEAAYRRRIPGVRTSVRLAALAPNALFVFGEVQRPGPITAPGPRTLLQLVAAAGGPLPTAATDQIRVIAADPGGASRVSVVDLDRLTSWGGRDFIVPPGSTVYVPPSRLARAANFVDLAIRRVLMFNGASIGLSYDVNGNGR